MWGSWLSAGETSECHRARPFDPLLPLPPRPPHHPSPPQVQCRWGAVRGRWCCPMGAAVCHRSPCPATAGSTESHTGKDHVPPKNGPRGLRRTPGQGRPQQHCPPQPRTGATRGSEASGHNRGVPPAAQGGEALVYRARQGGCGSVTRSARCWRGRRRPEQAGAQTGRGCLGA